MQVCVRAHVVACEHARARAGVCLSRCLHQVCITMCACVSRGVRACVRPHMCLRVCVRACACVFALKCERACAHLVCALALTSWRSRALPPPPPPPPSRAAVKAARRAAASGVRPSAAAVRGRMCRIGEALSAGNLSPLCVFKHFGRPWAVLVTAHVQKKDSVPALSCSVCKIVRNSRSACTPRALGEGVGAQTLPPGGKAGRGGVLRAVEWAVHRAAVFGANRRRLTLQPAPLTAVILK
jgi:hypothetical protein